MSSIFSASLVDFVNKVHILVENELDEISSTSRISSIFLGSLVDFDNKLYWSKTSVSVYLLHMKKVEWKQIGVFASRPNNVRPNVATPGLIADNSA
jgi:hypothetical protein